MLMLRAETAQRPNAIVQPVAVEDGEQRQRLVVGFGLAHGVQEQPPAGTVGGILPTGGVAENGV